MKRVQIIACFAAIGLAGCGRPDSATTTEDLRNKTTPNASSNTQAAASASVVKTPTFRAIDSEKDGFTIVLDVQRVEWNAQGVSSGVINNVRAIGTQANNKGAKVVLLKSGTLTAGEVETKGYGVIKIEFDRRGFSLSDVQLTDESISKIQSSLLRSTLAPASATGQTRVGRPKGGKINGVVPEP